MKKIISVLLLISLLLTAGTISAFATNEVPNEGYWIAETSDIKPEELPGTVVGILGDSDRDGKVNVKDATAIQKHLADIATFDEADLIFSDADMSGDINIKDATAIQKFVASIDIDLFVGHALYKPYDLDEKLFGEWKTTVDAAEIINAMLEIMFEEDPLAAKYIHLESFTIWEIYTFRDDYTFSITIDENLFATSLEAVKADLTRDFSDYFVALAREMGYNMSANEVAQSMGYNSVREFVEELLPDELWEETFTPFESYYRTAPGGKLYLNEYSDTFYETYLAAGGSIVITGNSDKSYPEEYPITLVRVEK